MTDVEVKVRELVAEILEVSPERAVPGASLAGDLGADDRDMAELAASMENSFNVLVDDRDIVGMVTVRDAVDTVLKLRSSLAG